VSKACPPGVADATSEKQAVGEIEIENREKVGVLSIQIDISTVVVTLLHLKYQSY
jgi:hypothetical protein